MTARKLAGAGALAALAALALAGCTSTGTISSLKTGSTATSTDTPTATTASTTESTAPSTTPSTQPSTRPTSVPSALLGADLKLLGAMIHDPGCKLALNGLSDFVTQAQVSPLKAVNGLPDDIKKMRDGAKQTKKPGAKDAITKMADDLQKAYDAALNGQQPDTSSMRADGAAFGQTCTG